MSETVLPAGVSNAAHKGAVILETYAPAAIGITLGYIVGDVFKVSNYVLGAVVKGGAQATPQNTQMSILITAGIYALIGIMIWRALGGHILGALIGGFFLGIALRGAIKGVSA